MKHYCQKTRCRKARKSHRCIECGVIIEPKELYQFISGVDCNGPYGVKMCLRCFDIWPSTEFLKVALIPIDEAPRFGELYEWLQQHLRPKQPQRRNYRVAVE